MKYKLIKNTPEIERIYTHKYYALMGIELEHSQPIASGFANTRKKAQKKKVSGDEVMRKGIQHARWWFAYLRLAIELEEKNIEIIVKPAGTLKTVKPVEGSGVGSGGARHIPRETTFIKVEKEHYKDWDLDQLMEVSFDDWWQDHRELFQSKLPQIVEKKDALEDDRHLLLQIDRTAPMTETISALRKLLSKQMDKKMPYEIAGQVRVAQLTSRFNAVVCALKGMSPKEIWNDKRGYIRASVENVPFDKSAGRYNYSAEFRKYYKGGVFHLLEVSKGRFGKGFATS